MGTIRIVTDSTSDLESLAGELGVTVVPLTVMFGTESLRDGIDIDSRTFFERLEHTHAHPSTSQPSPDLFEQTYRALIAEGATGIVSIHVSSKLSGTLSSATRAAQAVEASDGIPIRLVDSRQASLGMHFGIMAAARAISDGAGIDQVAEAAADAFGRSTVLLVADNLGYLQRGGRIGQAQRLIGTVLNVKPIISLRDGVVVALESPRTHRRAFERLVEYVRDAMPVEGVVVGQSSPKLGDELEMMVRNAYTGPIRRIWAGPTIGSHIGPGCAGLSFVRARV